jgi:hypothetical protein
MTLKEFNELDVLKQVETVWLNGELIGERADDMYTIYLFQIDGFYAEMFLNHERNEFTRYRYFSSTSSLNAYLDNIDISEALDSLSY